MSITKKIRKVLACFLAFAAACTVFAGDIPVSRAEENACETSDMYQETDTEEDMPEEPGSAEDAFEEENPEEELPKEELTTKLKEVSEEEPASESEKALEEKPEETFGPEAVAGEAEAVDEESEVIAEESESVVEELEAVVQESEAVAKESKSVVQEPEETAKESEEALQKEIENDSSESERMSTFDLKAQYPLCAVSKEITFQEKADGYVWGPYEILHTDKEANAGETISSQHRRTMNILCSKCKRPHYKLFPESFSEISVNYSDPLMIEDTNYLIGQWNEDDLMRGTGCLQLDSKIRKPGIMDVKLSYCVKFADYYHLSLYNNRCIYCNVWIPYSKNRSWNRYEESYRVYAYADYTLRYDANAGGEKVENMPLRERSRACRDSVEMKISDKRPERMGYDFLGWAEEETAVLSEYRPGDPVAINWTEGKNVEKILYAVWQKVVPGIGTPFIEPDFTFIKKACRADAVTPVSSVEVGEEYSYVVTVRNNTDYKVKDLKVSEVFNENLVQLLNTPNNYKNGIWTIDSLESGETAALVLPVKALAECPEYENTIHLLVKGEDGKEKEIPPGEDDLPSAVVEICWASGLTIQKEADRQTVEEGELLTYTILVSNPSNAAAGNVKIIDSLPDTLEWTGAFLQKPGENGLEDVEGRILDQEPEKQVYEAGDLEAGGTVTLTITAKVLETDADVIVNTAAAYKDNGPAVEATAYTNIMRRREPEKEEGPKDDPMPEEEKDPEPPSSPEFPERSVPSVIPPARDTMVPDVPLESGDRTEGSSLSYEKAETKTEASEDRADTRRKVSDSKTPLGHRGRHLCCILHFVILLLALLVEIFYTRSMKKHQKKIFELRKMLEEEQSPKL